ncbi:hypothetical protein [Oleiagrimonas sp. C23AA]|uniref:hypothetical protein n=1 Tax=Oleiagrimonas sp. C23AA TaxID=2719047 RepID=UPI0014243569|nr:hypothetical protein [Oleiagrimonas sp. C23AA]NII10906.1 hypothetical protein [Oleiagrimonas sp. C23AA]
MPRLPLLIATTLAIAPLGVNAATAKDIHGYTGKAHALDGGRLLWVEHHFRYQQDDGKQAALVLYSCPNGKAFARKRVQGGSAQAPNFAFVDALSGYREGVRENHGQRQIYVQRHEHADEKTKSLPQAKRPVIDAGFDAFVHAHWKTLTAGHSVSLDFLVPSKQRFIGFSASKRRGAPDGQVRFRLKLDSWFSFALPHLDVTYARDSRQLRGFSGLTNVRGANGKNVSANIQFAASSFGSRSATELDKARQAPLDGRCSLH